MSELIYYNSYDIFLNQTNRDKLSNIPGGLAFSSYFKIFASNIVAVDRTNTITTPLKTKVLPHLALPEYSTFTKTFGEICDERIQFLLHKAKHTNKKLVVMYSGGVDSTLILCSLLKNANGEQLKDVVILLSEHSIAENKSFYQDYVVRKFNCISSYRFPQYLGNDDYLFVSGENADQLFGSQATDSYKTNSSSDIVFKGVEESSGQLIDWFTRPGTEKYAESMYLLLKRMTDAAPIEIKNVYQFFWWINFNMKWQNVYVRILPYTLNRDTIKLEENYTTFYATKEFQLWSMNNVDNLVEKESYITKYAAKQYIIEVNGDADYINKPKIGSLTNMVRRKDNILTIDENMVFSNEYPSENLYNYDNDFMELK